MSKFRTCITKRSTTKSTPPFPHPSVIPLEDKIYVGVGWWLLSARRHSCASKLAPRRRQRAGSNSWVSFSRRFSKTLSNVVYFFFFFFICVAFLFLNTRRSFGPRDLIFKHFLRTCFFLIFGDSTLSTGFIGRPVFLYFDGSGLGPRKE